MKKNPGTPAVQSDDGAHIERENPQPALELGQWYWVKPGEDCDQKEEWIACVMSIGSNYVEVDSPTGSSERIHFNEVFERLRYEPNAPTVIAGEIARWTGEAQRLLGEVKAVTARLGLKTPGELPAPAAGSTDLVVMSGQVDVDSYRTALVKAKDITLPELFEQIREANEQRAVWMKAELLPLESSIATYKESIGEIEDRIFNLSLYAGLAEDAVKCSDGAPADAAERLHVMQRRLYMDEECLLNYAAGGMEFADIVEFDAWLSKPENRDRILPFPRTLVAMRVRRSAKERECDDLLSAFINIRAENADKLTFLYIRNGNQVWRIATDLEFDEMLFPDTSIYDPSEPLMIKTFCNRVEETMPRREWESRREAAEAERKKRKKDKSARPSMFGDGFRADDWEPFDHDSVYFDDGLATIAAEIKKYNRIAVIIQGLFDRSLILHPHLPVQAWSPDGFDRAIKLVYDAQMVLDNGVPPDIAAYIAQCNASLGPDSVVVGQFEYWLDAERKKEEKRRRTDWRLPERERWRDLPSYWRPFGNPGPVAIGQLAGWAARRKHATFNWERERLRPDPWNDSPIPCSISVPAEHLFNVSAYAPGDYLQFYRDHRTRAQYLKWAPALLAAEDYYASLKIRKPSKKGKK